MQSSRWRGWIRSLLSGPRSTADGCAPQEVTLLVRPLEERIVLEATGAGVQNTDPTNLVIEPVDVVPEDGTAELLLSFENESPLDLHTVFIDWGDGSPLDVAELPPGVRELTAQHQYLDDGLTPGGTPTFDYNVEVTVADDDGGATSASTVVTVANVDPVVFNLQATKLDDTGKTFLTGSLSDVGTLDSFVLTIDWGDPLSPNNNQTIDLAPGTENFVVSHVYPKPSNSSTGEFTITVTLVDDDTGSVTERTTAEVPNTDPSNLELTIESPINENDSASLAVRFDDPDSFESHRVIVNWGDGSPDEVFDLLPQEKSLIAEHQYLDDGLTPGLSPSFEYDISVTVEDNRGGSASAATSVIVNNVNPILDNLIATTIDEDQRTFLTGSIIDPGTLDEFSLTIDWGDPLSPNNIQVLTFPAGTDNFTVSHQYLDDNPSGTPADEYTISLTITDDDTGSTVSTASVTVNNVAPQITELAATNIDEGGRTSLTGRIVDPGSLDSHTLTINWGDPLSPDNVQVVELPAGAVNFRVSHEYVDDNPSGTPADSYTISVTLTDDDTGSSSDTASVIVSNVAPTLSNLNAIDIDENGFTALTGTISDVGTLDSFTIMIDWGDPLSPNNVQQVELPAGTMNFTVRHQYLDDNPTATAADAYTISVTLVDDDTGSTSGSTQLTVRNQPPTDLIFAPISPVDENSPLALSFTFDDLGTLDTHTVTVDWGDGSPIETGSSNDRTFASSHVYADNGEYTVNVTVQDDDLGEVSNSLVVTVLNVDPTLTVATGATIDEGALLSIADIGTFTDPGFDNPAGTPPTVETFEYRIDWGDGSAVDTGAATVDTPGSVGIPTAGSFDGSHTYADNGVFTVTITVIDDDGGSDTQSLLITVVDNVQPELTVVDDQFVDEGTLLNLIDIGTFIDPGFDNPLGSPPSTETFTYTIDWGDGSDVDSGTATIDTPGDVGTPTQGSFDGAHTYADDGVYTVSVSLFDDDEGSDSKTFLVTVANVNPSLAGVEALRVDEGASFTLAALGVHIQDPGFDNPENPLFEGGSTEIITALTVDWGDGTPTDVIAAENRLSGSEGVPTTVELSHTPHIYADNGTYNVTITFHDDDGPRIDPGGGIVSETFFIAVDNVAPTLVLTDRPLLVDEGALLLIPDLATFSDPAFNNPVGSPPTVETFTYDVDWGDGHVESLKLPLTLVDGAPGIATVGEMEDAHIYADNGEYTVTVTLRDDDGGVDVQTIVVVVENVAPTMLTLLGTDVSSEGETTIDGSWDDPGFDNPLASPPTVESFLIIVDWGDGSIETVPADGVTPQGFIMTHTYDGPPNPDNPAADIPISVRIVDDDGGEDGQVIFISNPGTESQMVRIDTTPDVPLLVFPPLQRVMTEQTRRVGTPTEDSAGDIPAAAGDASATAERYFEIVVVKPDGTETGGERLSADALRNLRQFFQGDKEKEIPPKTDNRYRIYYVNTETMTKRLVIDVFIRGGRIIDPSDDSEGTRDRPPTDESVMQWNADDLAAALQRAIAGEQEPNNEQEPLHPARGESQEGVSEPAASSDQQRPAIGRFLPNQSRWRDAAACLAVGMTVSGSLPWSQAVRAAFQDASPGRWKRMRRLSRPLRPRSSEKPARTQQEVVTMEEEWRVES